MSNALSIAAVTAVLKYLLDNGLVRDSITATVGDVIVTTSPPDKITVGTDERAQLNLFMYQITHNRNVDWVSQEFRSRYSRVNENLRSTHPPLALDLHYLLTAYGPKDFQSEILLGYAMQIFHQLPVITTDIIENALNNASNTSTSSVFSQSITNINISDFAQQIGQIKISPEFFKMEETSKIWSALQTNYRPSINYQVSMILIESDGDGVHRKFVNNINLSEPHIEQIIIPGDKEQSIIVGSKLLIKGKQLQGSVTKVRLGKIEKLLTSSDVTQTQISLVVPPDLQAGVQSVQVIHEGMPNTGQTYNVESNVFPFVLHPIITASVDEVQSKEGDLRSVKISIQLNLKVGKEQRVMLLLNKISNHELATYTINIAPRNEDSDTIIINVNNIKPGNYLVRIRVDGAENPLSMNQNGEYDSPQIAIV